MTEHTIVICNYTNRIAYYQLVNSDSKLIEITCRVCKDKNERCLAEIMTNRIIRKTGMDGMIYLHNEKRV